MVVLNSLLTRSGSPKAIKCTGDDFGLKRKIVVRGNVGRNSSDN